jgi:hypothetical protein
VLVVDSNFSLRSRNRGKKKEKLLLCLLQLGFVERSENCDKKIDTAT